MKVLCKYDKMLPVSEFRGFPNNPNLHSKEQVERLAKILEYQGIRAPVVISNLSGHCVKGHGTVKAIIKNGWTEIPIVYQDFSDHDQEYAYVVSDNSIASWADLDFALINNEIPEFSPDFDIDMLGIEDFEIEPADKYADKDADAIPEVKESFVKTGDIWQLGEHRLMCGDATDLTQVVNLMDGTKADLWLTDPPYGVGLEAREKSSSSWVNKNRKNSQITNDDKSLEEMKEFWTYTGSSALVACSDRASYYWFACQGGDQMMMMMMMALGEAGWQVKHELMWLKDQMVFGRCDYHYKHEPILYGWKRGGTHEWCGDRTQTSVLEYTRPKSSVLHPTMKPVELLQYLMANNTRPNQAVLDTFGGSGSTLIACEKTNRKCFMMEIDPHYCGIIITRWQEFSGQKAVRLTGT
jgi:site-specific DNA-methyltransferase (adenine-specific)